MKQRTLHRGAFLFFISALLATCCKLFSASEITFFQDAIVCFSKPAHFYFDNNLCPLPFCGYYDNGDPRIFQYLLAVWWKFAGHNLVATHVFFLPFVLLGTIQVWRLALIITGKETRTELLFCVFLFTACLFSSPLLMFLLLPCADCILVSFFLWALVSVIKNHRTALSVCLLLMCMVMRRGMLISAAIIVSYLLICSRQERERHTIIKTLAPALPATFFVLGFIVYRYYTYGWIYSTAGNAWSSLGGLATMEKCLQNTAFFLFSLADRGRIFLWIFLFSILIRHHTQILKEKDPVTIKFSILFFVLSLFLTITTVPTPNYLGQRFYSPLYILLILITFRLVFLYCPLHKRIFYPLLTCFILSGHFWIYPQKMAVDWSCSIRLLPFFNQREIAINTLRGKGIAGSELSGGMNIYGNYREIMVNDEYKAFSIPQEINEQTHYYIYSPISDSGKDRIIDFTEQNNTDKIYEFKSVSSAPISIYRLNKQSKAELIEITQ